MSLMVPAQSAPNTGVEQPRAIDPNLRPRPLLGRQSLSFLWRFAIWSAILFSLVYNPIFIREVINPLAIWLTGWIEAVLVLMGNEISRSGTVLASQDFAMEIYYKCTGVYQAAGLLAGILASPVSNSRKLRGSVLTIGALCSLNTVRIISIFYAGILAPGVVPVFHGVFWEGLMIAAAFGLWLYWLMSSPELRRKQGYIRPTRASR